MSVPTVEHFEHHIVNLLSVGLGNARMGAKRIKLPSVLLLGHQGEARSKCCEGQNGHESSETFGQQTSAVQDVRSCNFGVQCFREYMVIMSIAIDIIDTHKIHLRGGRKGRGGRDLITTEAQRARRF
jgi:hypothetical protein